MLIQIFVLKVTNNERNILTHHEIIDRMAKQIESVITQVCKESKLWIHPNLQRPSFSLMISFKFTYLLLYCRYMNLKKGILLRNHSQPLKLQQNKILSQILIRRGFKKVEISSCLRYCCLSYEAIMHRLKSMFSLTN